METNQPRPPHPSADNAFELLKQLVGAAPQQLQDRQNYEAKLAAAQQTVALSIEACQEKQRELDTLRQQKREMQEVAAFEQMKLKAEEFNNQIDSVVALLDSMRLLAAQAGGKRLEVSSADLRELPYCSISENIVRIRRRFDVLQQQRG